MAEYYHYTNIFLAKNLVNLLKYVIINDYIIELEKSK